MIYKMQIENALFRHVLLRRYDPPDQAIAYVLVWDFIYPAVLVESGECIVCRRTFSGRRGLAFHLRGSGHFRVVADAVVKLTDLIVERLNEYSSTNHFKCRVCGYRACKRAGFVKHVLEKHPDIVESLAREVLLYW